MISSSVLQTGPQILRRQVQSEAVDKQRICAAITKLQNICVICHVMLGKDIRDCIHGPTYRGNACSKWKLQELKTWRLSIQCKMNTCFGCRLPQWPELCYIEDSPETKFCNGQYRDIMDPILSTVYHAQHLELVQRALECFPEAKEACNKPTYQPFTTWCYSLTQWPKPNSPGRPVLKAFLLLIEILRLRQLL